MSMRTYMGTFLIYALFCISAQAAIPLTINHQGIVKVNGEPFTGNGQFKFGFIDAAAKWLWTNDGTHIGEAAGAILPDSVVTVSVNNGVYNICLGDNTIPGMISIPGTVFDSADVRLRVIFDDGVHGAELLIPDQPMCSAPYAYQANNADLLDGKHLIEVMPSGVIVMWSGTITTIPAGWSLCDGSNGTPDLRDRFIVGAAQDDSGIAKTNVKGSLMQTGGEHQHVLTTMEMPSHTHLWEYYNAPGGGQFGAKTGMDPTELLSEGLGGGTPSWKTCAKSRFRDQTTGNDQPHENCPPFYALAFIMKM